MSAPRSHKVTPLSGFPEFLPAQRIVEQHFLDVIRETFELHGFASIETRAVEPVERLSSQGEDADKEIYAVSRLGASEQEAAREARLGLHFDLTVPFARYVLENAGRLDFPFRRYQIQRVWRGERPQEGRFREFTQADIDVVGVGELPFHYEVELPLVIAEVFQALPVGPFRIQVNNRKVPEGFYRGLGLVDVTAVLRIVDKLDKVGAQTVEQMLLAAGATAAQAAACLELAQISGSDPEEVVQRVKALGVSHPTLDEGLVQLAAVLRGAAEQAPGLLVADLSVARGLDYYTGTVYETRLVCHESYGAVCSGGRYDALASDGRTTYPGVGLSIGVTRLLAKLFGEGLTATRSTPTCVLVALAAESDRAQGTRVAAALRARGIAVEVAPSAAKFGKQIRYADRRGIPFVWFPATSDGDSDQVKDIRSGDQVDAGAGTWTPPEVDRKPQLLTGSRSTT